MSPRSTVSAPWLVRFLAIQGTHTPTRPCQHREHACFDGQMVCTTCGEIVGETPAGHRSQTTDDTATLGAQQADVVRLMSEAAPANDVSATEPRTETCTHHTHFPPTPTDGPTRQCRHCPHVWQVPCACGAVSWRPDASGAAVVWLCTSCGAQYGVDQAQPRAQPLLLNKLASQMLNNPHQLEEHSTVWRCPSCKGTTRRWRSIYDVVICATCHPPGAVALVGEWLEDGEA